MKFLDLSFDTPERNLACDEALLDVCVQGRCDEGILRFWESPRHFVALGYANRMQTEIHLKECERLAIPVLRRCTGGGTVLQGPGCFNYALVLQRSLAEPLRTITGTNTYVLTRHARALSLLLGAKVERAGTSDLAINERKFSGNSQRRRENWTLIHGTFLHAFDIPLMGKVLQAPSKEPEYRRGRSHADFVTNVNVSPSAVRNALVEEWNASELLESVPLREIDDLVRSRYARREWITRL